jgi:O-antigen ligase
VPAALAGGATVIPLVAPPPAVEVRRWPAGAWLAACAAAVATAALVSPELGALLILAVAGAALVATSHRDGVTLLTVFAALLLLVPSRLVVSALNGIGIATPAMLLALVITWVWVLGRLVPSLGLARGLQPVRLAAYAYGLAVTASYVAASLRPLPPILGRAGDRGLVVTATTLGLCVFAADAIGDRARLDTLLRRLVAAGCGLAAIGIVQFATGFNVAEYIRSPGLEFFDDPALAIGQRSTFNRVAGTTYHPIEFATVLAMLLPLALHYAWTTRQRRWWIATGMLAAAIPMSVSRTGLVALIAAALVMVPTWDRRRRWQALAAGAVLAVFMKASVPGLLGTVRSLFLNLGVDPSVTGRRVDYGYVASFIAERPVFGQGYATFIPRQFAFLDNQVLLTLVETGVVGLVTLLAVFAVGIGLARRARRHRADPTTRDLGQTLVACLVVPLVTFATFDFLSFPTARGVAFVLIGCAGALWRLTTR